MSRKLSSGLRRVIGQKRKSFCGFCFDKINAVSTKSFNTVHIIRNVDKDDELQQMYWLIECTRCGHEVFYYPKLKAMGKAEAQRLKARYDYNKKELKRRQGLA